MIPTPSGYSIYSSSLDRWSGGGIPAKWKKNPKIWNGIGPLKNHLSGQISADYQNKIFWIPLKYSECVIYDHSTGKEYDGMTIKEYFLDYISRQSVFYKNWSVKEK